MNKKIILIAISYLLGSIGGAYLNKNIALFFYLFLVIYFILSKKKILKLLTILSFILACCTSNSKLELVNDIYNKNEIILYGTIIDKEEAQGKIKYSAQIIKCSNSRKYAGYKMVFYNNIKLDVGESFTACGSFSNPDKIHNYKGFNYKNLLLSKESLGTFNLVKIDRAKHKGNTELKLIYSVKNYICNILDNSLPRTNAELCKSLILGDKSSLDDNIIESFSNSSLSHILAISGMHVMYISSIIMLCTSLLKKKASYIINIVGIAFFCRLVGSGEPVYRATIMISLFIVSKILHRNSDSITNLSVALIMVLIKNPFCVYSAGFQLSFLGTFGIIILYKKINIKSCKNKLILYVQSQIALSSSANIFLLPIIAVKYNKISINFFISSTIASMLLTIIMPLICICLLLNNHVKLISIFFSKLLCIATCALIKFSQIVENIKWTTFLVTTPSTIEIIFYYLVVLIFCGIMYGSQKDRKILRRLCSKLIVIWLICCLTFNCFSKFKCGISVFFIDVGQGDATLIITEKNKKILVDGGGDDKSYVGKNILLPYLLDRKIKTLDYVIISHFDTDHIRWYFVCNG